MNDLRLQTWRQWRNATIYAPGDDEEVYCPKRYGAASLSLLLVLGLIAGMVYACMHFMFLVYLMAVFLWVFPGQPTPLPAGACTHGVVFHQYGSIQDPVFLRCCRFHREAS